MKNVIAILVTLALFLAVGCDGVNNISDSDLESDGLEFAGKKAPMPQFEGTGNYYMAVEVPEGITWTAAREAAAAAGTYRGCTPHLATITSPEENNFIVTTFENVWPDGYWLGGYQPDSNEPGSPNVGWAWVTGEPFNYTNWGTGEPNDSPYPEDALHFSGPYNPDDGTWNDLPLDPPFVGIDPVTGYVVEWTCDTQIGKATGSGHYSYQQDGEEGYRTFSFTAIGTADGQAKGQWQLNNRRFGTRIHGTVECLVVDGNMAWFSGPTTSASDPARIDEIRGFLVVDNGEGQAVDEISNARLVPTDNILTAAGWCAYRPQIRTVPIENGNVQVH